MSENENEYHFTGPEPASMMTMTYERPNDDPKYWQMVTEYVVEANADGNIPETFGDFLKDLALWVKGGTAEDTRVKVLTPEEDEFLGNELYSLLEINEDVNFGVDDEIAAANTYLRELVEREWVPK
jgi:hypothetical protein